jgi:hypothetical protein
LSSLCHGIQLMLIRLNQWSQCRRNYSIYRRKYCSLIRAEKLHQEFIFGNSGSTCDLFFLRNIHNSSNFRKIKGNSYHKPIYLDLIADL